MLKLDNYRKNNLSLLLKIPEQSKNTHGRSGNKALTGLKEQYDVKIKLESIHYTGKDYGYGWTFVVSTLKRHWISRRIQIQRGRKSIVNKDVFHNTINTSFHNLQHLPITICAQHISGFKTETTLRLKPGLFRMNLLPTSIYTEISRQDDGFRFHELHSVEHEAAKLMFVLSFEISAEETSGYIN